MSIDKFYYYSKSKDVPPGKGIYERINDIKDYERIGGKYFQIFIYINLNIKNIHIIR